jgi:Fic-DOC domain mobile mystery protein B
MLDELFQEPKDATPLNTGRERRSHSGAYCLSRRFECGRARIARGQDWALARKRDLLSEKSIKDLHQRMLGDVWRWAGKFRITERNLGIHYFEIPMAVRELLENAKTWVEHKTYPPDQISVRFHHRLVKIHPFPNGNGRHSRMMADLLVMRLGGERFTWGRASLQQSGDVRKQYIDALRAADNHDYEPLLRFARS